MDDITRVCRKCGQEKPLSEFAKDKTRTLGHSYICKQCKYEQSRNWRAANPEKVREWSRKWRAANPEKVRTKKRKWRAANPEKVRTKKRKWREANLEKVREYDRKRYAANPEKVRERSRKWREANPEKVREWSRKWREANPEKARKWCREYGRKKRENLADGYLINQLKRRNLPVTPETIDYKRIQLKLYREIKNQQNDERD